MSIKHSERLIHFDLMRIIACYFVIIIHIGICGQTESWAPNSYNALVSSFYGIISRWAVPCFVLLSGAMFLNQNREIPIKKLYGKYILRLGISYVFWSVVYALYNMIYATDGSIGEMLHYFLNNCFSGELHMWYVLMTIGLYIITPVLKVVVDKAQNSIIKYWLAIMFIFACAIPFISDLNIPYLSGVIAYLNKYMELYFVMGYVIYFVIGHYLINKTISEKRKKLIYALGLISVFYCIIVLIVLRIFTNITLGALSYSYPQILFIGMAAVLFFKEKVSKIHFSQKTKQWIVKGSGLSYGIFLIHVLVIKVLYHAGINLSIANVAISIPIVSLIAFFISAIVIFIISKIPFINKFII